MGLYESKRQRNAAASCNRFATLNIALEFIPGSKPEDESDSKNDDVQHYNIPICILNENYSTSYY